MRTDVDTALKDIADFYIKNRRGMTEPELAAILKKHVESEAEAEKFVGFLETEPGQLRFKTLLRERKEQKPSTLKEEGWVYVKVGTTEVRGRKVPDGMDIEQVSPTFNRDDFDKAVRIIEEKLAVYPHLYDIPTETGSNPKEPWQTTRQEFIKQDLKRYREDAKAIGFTLNERLQTKLSGEQHEKTIRKALSIGKPVPAEVLKDYPELTKLIPKAVTPEVTTQPPQGKIVQRSYRTPVGIVVDFGIQIGDVVYEPRASAVSPLGVSEAKKGWREVTTQERENYRGWEKKQGKFGNRARAIDDIEKRWEQIIAKGKTSQEHEKEQLASYESYMKRRAEAERQYSLKSSDLIVGMALEEIATGNRYVITEITDEGWVYARPENKPTESGGSIGKGEVRGYRLAIQKTEAVTPEVTPVMKFGIDVTKATEEEYVKAGLDFYVQQTKELRVGIPLNIKAQTKILREEFGRLAIPKAEASNPTLITEEQLLKVRKPIPFTPTKRLMRDDVLYVVEEDVPHPIYGYSKYHKEYSVIDLRGYRKGYEPKLDILGIYTPNLTDTFRLQTGKLPPYQPMATGDKLLEEMRRIGVHKAYRIER